ncbi:Uncharacterized oxidoreductase YqkF [[Clostridium] ultunense Esp]|uniref:aldo/keto reductase n=1 Tax=Thermicanus aegyptius TaxID=94009 RepID=UPI0002B701EB|nr:aldo/keto reductase [Thermicanus aegyptius]CCQ96521.1 Uncharacterized oxidoreductase YqkF [[Clostridium] ultunense Esp]
MKKNPLGHSQLFVTEIGFGAMSIGTDEKTGIRLIHEALDLGVNFIDTADLYDHGQNEKIVGKAIQGRRDQVVLATKVGNRWREDGTGWDWVPSKEYIKEAVQKSLARLKTDYIDLYQLHGGTIEDPIDEIIEAFEELVQAGAIRYYGISSIRPNVIREYLKRSRIASVMMQYGLLDRRPEEEMLDLLYQNGVSLIARGPLAKGLLTDRILKEERGDDFLGHSYREIRAAVKKMKKIRPEISLSSLSLRYPLSHPAVATVIPGASKIEQMQENVRAAKTPPLTEEEKKALQSLFWQDRYELHR